MRRAFAINPPMASHCLLEGRRESLLKEQEAFADLVVVDAVVKAPPRLSFVEVAEATGAVSLFLDNEYGHRRGIDACDRADASVGVGGADLDAPSADPAVSLVDVICESLEYRPGQHGPPLTAVVLIPRHRCSGSKDAGGGHPGYRVDCR